MSTRLKLILAFSVVYFVWGSTYLAIKLTLDAVPPFLMMGSRFVLGGLLLFPLAQCRAKTTIKLAHLGPSLVLALTMVVMGTGMVAWVQQYITSGVTALIIAVSPVWLVMLEALRRDGAKPGWAAIAGVSLGMLGTTLLMNPSSFEGEFSLIPIGVLLLSTFSWCAGSIYSRHKQLPLSGLQTTSLQMILGGLILTVWGLATGEASLFAVENLTATALAAWVYLILFGSVIVFPCYIWLMKASTPAAVGTHAYVNPIVALFLGWLIVGEAITGRTLTAAGIILCGVLLIAGDGKWKKRRIRRQLTTPTPCKETA